MAKELSELKPVYLIHGSEDYLLERAVERLVARLASVADPDYNLSVFHGDKVEVDEVIAAANQLPFMSERRLVVVRDVEEMPSDSLAVLAEYAADPNPSTVLVLVGRKIARNSRLFKAVDALGGVAEYKAPSKRDYPRAVVEMFEERGKRVGLDAAETLVRSVGYDLNRLSTEIDKVLAYAGEETTLTRAEVEQVMSTTAPTSVWDLLDAVGTRNARETLRLTARLVAEGESVHGLMPRCVARLRDLVSVRALIDRGEGSPASIARTLGRPEWQVRNLPRQASRFTESELVDALRAAADTDQEMKTSRDPRLAFERWLLAVCA